MIDRFSGFLAATALATVVGMAGVADAANYSLSGKARDKRGQIELPLGPSLFAVPQGIPINGTAMQTGLAVPGGGPATITFPPAVASDNPTVTGGFLVPIPNNVQLTTLFKHSGPTVTTTLMASRSGPGDFGFCPGAAANPVCTTVAAGGSQGTLDGIIRYTAGPNKFGGTFKMLLNGKAQLTNKGNALPSTATTSMGGMTPALPFSVKNYTLAGSGFVPAGLPYGSMTTNIGATKPATHPLSYKATPMGLLKRGPAVSPGIAFSNQQTVFPMTTGIVYGYALFGAQASAPGPPFKATSSGYDKRTAAGAGRIQLVGGSLSRTFPTDNSNPAEGSAVNRMVLTFNFTPQPALPLSSPAMLMTLGLLVLISAGYAVSRRARQ